MLKRQLYYARKSAGKTQKQVAEHLGIDPSSYCGYEKGKRRPDPDKLRMIADFLGVTTDYLLGTSPDAAGTSGKNKFVVCQTSDENTLVKKFRSLSPTGKAAALAAVKGMADNDSLRK